MNHALLLGILLALLAGAVLPIQIGINASLSRAVGSSLWAATASFSVGAIALLSLVLITRQPLQNAQPLSQLPFWLFCGGLLGAVHVSSAIMAAQRLSAALLVALLVGGQMLIALWLDHRGTLGYGPEPISATRLLGAALIVTGVVLIRRS
jgi:transporter family-2 protein